jgi:hypothetical protein
MHDKFKKRAKVSRIDSRLRRKIAGEAAKRLIAALGDAPDQSPSAPFDLLELDAASANDYLAAKRKAVAVLGRRIRPTDLPTDDEVREQVIGLLRQGVNSADLDDASEEDEEPEAVVRAVDHLDRFTYFKLRLEPLEAVKQDPRTHPEGDALYHSLQVFERAREAHPHDEEFLLAALLHDVGKAIDPRNHVSAGVEALRGWVTERTLRLVEHHPTTADGTKRRRPNEPLDPEWSDDLELLREFDKAGRVPGIPVGTVDEALAYLRDLEREAFLDDRPE